VKRARPTILAVGLASGLALVASACGDTAPVSPALSVNGDELSNADFVDQLELLAGNAAFVNAISSLGVSVETAPGRFSTDFAASQLSSEIQARLIRDEVTVRGLTIDAAIGTYARQVAPFFIGLDPSNPATGAAFNALPEDYRAGIERIAGERITLQASLGGVGNVADAIAEAGRDVVCVSQIAFGTEEEAVDAFERIADGEDFVTVAGQIQGNDGVLGCISATVPPDGLPPVYTDLLAAPVGEVQEPVEAEGSWLVLVTEPASESEAISVAVDVVVGAGGPAFSAWLAEASAAADVFVDARYGTWDPTQGSVVPPSGTTAPRPQPLPGG
jgi:hypothetical protein